MRVFVTGATGFVGSRLVRDLLRRGDQVIALTRDRKRMRAAEGPTKGEARLEVLEGDPAIAGPWQQHLSGCDAIVALAGEPILGKRWSQAFKARAEHSRVAGMRCLAEAIGALPVDRRPKTLLAASAVGYYGPHGDEPLTEEAGPGSDFLSGLCARWEEAAGESAAAGVRVVNLRIGVVLGDGGALQKMLPAFRAFVGGPIGSGKQYLSFIHLDDVIGIILLCLDHDDARLRGPINVTAPQPVTMAEFARGLGHVLRRPALLPVPAFAVKLLFGESSTALLTGQRVLPQRAQAFGYKFRYPDLIDALSALFVKTGEGP